MAIDGIEVHVVSRPFDERFNMEFVFVFNDTLDDGNRLLVSRCIFLFLVSDNLHFLGKGGALSTCREKSGMSRS
jgi:hypothetical protein